MRKPKLFTAPGKSIFESFILFVLIAMLCVALCCAVVRTTILWLLPPEVSDTMTPPDSVVRPDAQMQPEAE